MAPTSVNMMPYSLAWARLAYLSNYIWVCKLVTNVTDHYIVIMGKPKKNPVTVQFVTV